MSSIGWATNYGIGATALFALVFLPAFLRPPTAAGCPGTVEPDSSASR